MYVYIHERNRTVKTLITNFVGENIEMLLPELNYNLHWYALFFNLMVSFAVGAPFVNELAQVWD